MSINKTREELVKMYVDSLKEGNIPWRQRWVSSLNINGLTHQEYRGVNQLLLSFVTYKEKYNDNRWMTYKQIKDKGYKLKEAKGKGVPVEFWSAYDIKNKQKISISDYENIIRNKPEVKDDYKLFCNTSYVFNGSLIDGLPQKDMYPYDKEHWKEKQCLYFISAMRKAAGTGWSYSTKFTRKLVAEMEPLIPIKLLPDNSPVIDSTHQYHPKGYVPDWEYMEKYIKAIEKLVIKDVVKYKDELIEKMKEEIKEDVVVC